MKLKKNTHISLMNSDEQAAYFNAKVMVQTWYSEAFDEIRYNGSSLASIISLHIMLNEYDINFI